MFAPRKSILVSKPPNQFPNCWFHIPDENDLQDGSNIPTYDLDATKLAMDRTIKLCSSAKNVNVEEEQWETKILRYGWSPKQIKLFSQVVKILDYDRLARLAYADNKRFEGVQRRLAIDKSADRLRKVLAAVSWDTQIVQWIHGLLMEYLPPSYLAAYLDIMQALKAKLPSLVDKMIFWKPGHVNQELLAPILRRPWQPLVSSYKYRKLPGNSLLVVIPSAAPRLSAVPSRIQKLYTLFTTMAPMLPVQLHLNNIAAQKQPLQSIAEQEVSITRTKIQELKAENPDRRLILIGMNSASALALQVALVEQVSGVVCFGFSCNTVHGVRGQADDHFLDLTTPVLFLVGQNSARTSEEEIEFLREKLAAPTSVVVVGSADDYLRVSKTKRRIEGVTQEMVDNMVIDEIAEFASVCVQRPVPAKVKSSILVGNGIRRDFDSSIGPGRKRKTSLNGDIDGVKGGTVKSQKLMRPTSTSDDVLEMAVQSILPDHDEVIPTQTIKTTLPKFSANRIVSGSTISSQKLKVTPHQFQTMKQQPVTQTKYVTISGQKNGQKTIQLQARPMTRPVISNSNSRPITPTSHTQYIVSNRVPHKIPIAQQHQQSFSPKKYTIVRSSTNTSNISYISESSTDLSGTNIFDMPIVFADNEGNIDEEASTMSEGSVISVASDSPPQSSKQVVLKTSAIGSTSQSFTITRNKNVLIQKPAPGKMFIINGTVVGKQVALPTNNIVLSKNQSAQPPQMKLTKFVPGSKIVKPSSSAEGKKIEILNNTIIRPASTSSASNLTRIQSTSFVNLADGKPITSTRLSLPITSSSSIKNQIVIKSNALKPYTGAQILPSSIGGNKQLGNLTVKRLNVVPSPSITKVFKKN